jgi:K+-sensing histidine kinase KdpD
VVLATQRPAARDRVLLAVMDSGPGLPPEALPALFQRWSQPAGPDSARPERGRMGLGLYLAWGIVQAHGGSIRAYNLPGGGACFEVTLPLAPSAEAALATQEAAC